MIYTFEDKDGNVKEYNIKLSDYDDFKKNNPHLKRIILTTPKLISMHGSIDSKTPDSFKEVLSKIADHHPNSPLADRYKRKTSKEVKIDELKKKHRVH